jgi:glycosyltransferase involved in cell wall biosynthesis
MTLTLASRSKRIPVVGTTAAPLPRVLYAIVLEPGRKFGSLEEQMVVLADAFRARGSLFLPLFVWPGRDGPSAALGTDAECLDLGRFRFGTLRRLLLLLNNHRIGVMHWNFSPPLANSYLWWLTLLRPRLKHVFTDHNSRLFPLPGPERGWKRVCKRLFLRRYARVLCVSQFVKDRLVQQQTWANLVCCRHFINTARFQPNPEVRAQLRVQHDAEGRFIVLSVAHLIRAKGVDVLLRALGELPRSVLAWVIGNGVESEALQRLSRDTNVADRVRFLGPRPLVEPFMQAADCFVCPSLWAEAAGLVNVEAQASGLPVLASDVGGIPEYVVDGQTGFLFPRGDHRQLAERIRRLLEAPHLARQLGEQARRLAHQQFSPQARLPDFLEFYRL